MGVEVSERGGYTFRFKDLGLVWFSNEGNGLAEKSRVNNSCQVLSLVIGGGRVQCLIE